MKDKSLGAGAAAVEGGMATSQTPAIARHTPTPWTVRPYYTDLGNFAIQGELNVARTISIGDEAEELANAEFIVRACNSHDELLELLKEHGEIATVEEANQWEHRKDAAIKKAEGR